MRAASRGVPTYAADLILDPQKSPDDDDDHDSDQPEAGDVEGQDEPPSLPTTPDEPAAPFARPTRGRPRKFNSPSTTLLAQSIALPPSIPPSPATTPPPPLSDFLSPPVSGKHRHRSRSLSDSSGSGGDHHVNRKPRSRRQSPADSVDPLSPATSIEAEEPSDDGEEAQDQAPAPPGKSDKSGQEKVVGKARRGPTAREKKEIARKRKVEARRAKAGASAAERARSTTTRRGRGGGDDAVLMEVKELFI